MALVKADPNKCMGHCQVQVIAGTGFLKGQIPPSAMNANNKDAIMKSAPLADILKDREYALS